MKQEIGKQVVVSVGGSLIFPREKPDVVFLKALRQLILDQISKTDRDFYIVTGGGKLCRLLNSTADEVWSGVSELQKHILGTRTTQLNGYLVQSVLSDVADPLMVCNYDEYRALWPENKGRYRVTVGAGWKYGHSSDVDAMEFVSITGSKILINLSNVDYVYDQDPREARNAKAFERLLWSEYFGLIPPKFTPAAHVPFDQIASKEAETSGVSVIMMSPGDGLYNFASLLNGQEFKGTVISG